MIAKACFLNLSSIIISASEGLLLDDAAACPLDFCCLVALALR
jgi:hypothetical protein